MTATNGVLIVGELSVGQISPITLELLSVGRKLADGLGQELAVLFITNEDSPLAKEVISYGADKVYVITDPVFEGYLTDSYVAGAEKLVRKIKPEIMLLGHNSFGSDLSARLAFRLETGLTQDCIKLELDLETGLLQKTKPVYGGNALAVYVCEEGRPQMATLRPRVVKPATSDGSRRGEVISFDPELDPDLIQSKFRDSIKDEIPGVKLEEAEVVICGGRGIGGFEQFEKLEEVAAMLGGAVGATRPPCDAKWCPARYQIGLTGKLVSPKLYIGIALSGASQHLAGISGSKTIVAINKDPEANIFSVAQYGVVGDYNKILPAFVSKCREMR